MARLALAAPLDWLRAAGHTIGPSDAQLLGQFAHGRDEAAFAEIIRRHGPRVLGVCRRVTGHEQDAEEAFQATFLVLARKAGGLADAGALAAWLHGVAYHKALKARAAAARRRARERQVEQLPERPVEPQLWTDLALVLDRELAALPEALRAAVILCELEGRPRKEAAAALGVPEGTLSSRLANARRRLARSLSRRGEAPAGVALAAAWARGAAAVPAELAARAAAALPAGLVGVTPLLGALVVAVVVGTVVLAVGVPERQAPVVAPRAAQPAAPAGPAAEVGALLKRGAAEAEDIKDLQERASILSLLAQAHHRAGDKAAAGRLLKEARLTADKIEPGPPLYAALRAISSAEVARGNAAEALKIAGGVENTRERAGLVYFVIGALARQGEHKAALKLAEAQKGAERTSALVEVATEQAKGGDVAGARKALAAAADPQNEARVLVEIARAHARDKQRDKAKATLAEARKAWEKVVAPRDRPNYLAQHALDMAETGDAAGALQTWGEAMGASENWNLLWRLAAAVDRAGDARAAEKIADGVKTANGRHMVWQQLARERAVAGDKAGAKAALAKARQLEPALTNALSKQFRFVTDAEVEMRLGDAKAAVATARRGERGRVRGEALWQAGKAQRGTDRAGAVKTLAEAAGELVGEEKQGWWSPMFRQVMRDLAAAGGRKEAVALLDRSKSPRVRALGLVGVIEGVEAAKTEVKKP